MKNKVVLYEKRGHVAIITLNRPEAYNSVTKGLVDGIMNSILKAENDDSVHAMVMTGSGPKAFCAGLDLKVLSQNPTALSDDGPMLAAFANRKKPLIGAINGYCVTGGFELALMCDLLYASENAVFSDTHCKVNLIPGWGLSQRLGRLIGYGRAKEMSLTGKKIDAQTALAWGLVNRVFPIEQLLAETIKLANDMAKHNPKIIQGIRKVMDTGAAMSIDAAIAYEYQASRAHNGAQDFTLMDSKLSKMRKEK